MTALLPFLGRKETNEETVKVFDILVTRGNAKEVFLKCVEGLRSILWERTYDNDQVDDSEAMLSEKLAKVTTNDDGIKVDPILQTVGLYQAVKQGMNSVSSN